MMMASQKLPNCFVGVCAYLRCILRHCGVLYVRLIPQDLRALHLGLFEVSLRSLICLAISFDDFLWDHQ